MQDTEKQPFTWRQLKEFANRLTEEQLNTKVGLFFDDNSYAKPIEEAFQMQDDIYVNKDNDEDGGSLEVLKEAHGDDFNIEDYELSTKKGTPFLWSDTME